MALYRRMGKKIIARCEDCDALWEEANAHAVGVQHSRKYGHTVIVGVNLTYEYSTNPPPEDEEPPQ